MDYQTEQENFWAGDFGSEYVARNNNSQILSSDIHLFSGILSGTEEIRNVLEFGSNIGLNLRALKTLLPNLTCSAIEINESAQKQLKRIADEFFPGSILDYTPEKKYDLVLCKGILIHINPDFLPALYQKIYDSSRKYIVIAEYYNPTPVMVPYRGNNNRLFKRDFAGELLTMFPDLELCNYGFVYHRDKQFPMDDVNWFLIRKK